jgi:hypothetical protein
MKSPYTNIKSKPPKSISNQHNIKVPNKEKNLGTKIKKEKRKKQNIFQSTTSTRLY